MNTHISRNDPCFCGSGLKYKKCCLPHQRKIETEQLSHRQGVEQALALLNHTARDQIDAWVEHVWLEALDEQARQGIASADARIRTIHDANLLELLMAEGRWHGDDDALAPLQMLLNHDALQLDQGQRDYLHQLTMRPLSLYQVQPSDDHTHFYVQPYPIREEDSVCSIADKWVSRMLDAGDVVGLRLMKLSDGSWETSGAIYHIPEEFLPPLLEEMAQAEPDTQSLVLAHYWLRLVAAHV